MPSRSQGGVDAGAPDPCTFRQEWGRGGKGGGTDQLVLNSINAANQITLGIRNRVDSARD